MSASGLSPSFIHHLRHKGRWGWLMALCWLFLNAQLALAGHHCDLAINNVSPSAQHQAHLKQTISHSSHHDAAAQQTPLCEKHCVPDTVNQDNAFPALVALPVSGELALADQPREENCATVPWFSPPIVGPPAEIRFCRFIE